MDDCIGALSFLLQSRIVVSGQSSLPGNENYTQVCRLSSVTDLPTQGDDVTRKFQSIFLRRVAMEYDEIKFVLLTYKRSYSQQHSSPAFQSLRVVAREACIERILTQLLSLCSESDEMGDSLWMSVANQNSASHDSRLLSALKHLTGSDSESAPIPEQLLPSLVSKLIGNELGTSALFRMMRAGCEQIKSVESLEKVAALHQEVFPPVERLVSLQEFSEALAHQLLKEVRVRATDTGRYYSHSSCMSELLGYSLLMPNVNVKYMNNSCYIPFKTLPGYPRDLQRMLQNSNTFKQQNSEYTHKLCKLSHALLKKILRIPDKNLKVAPLLWFSDVINSHQLLATAKFIRGKEDQLVAHPGWRLNFCYLLLLFCEPFFSRTANQKLALISIDYVISEECRLDLSNESCLARGVIGPRPLSSSSDSQSNANFITEIFYFTLRALNLLLISPMNQTMQVVSDLSKAAQNLPPESPERDSLQELSGLTFITWDLTLLNEQFALMVSQFYITAAIWLNMSVAANQKEALSHVPEFLIKDSCQWLRFLVTSSPNLFRLLEMAPVIDLFVLLLQRQDLMPGPVSQSKVVSFLLSLIQTQQGPLPINSWSSVQGELATILHSNPTVRDRLGPALLTAYSAVDVVEGLDVDKDSFDKFSARQDITNLITHLWSRQDCRDSVLRQCSSPVFPTFLNSILDTLLYMLNDSIHRLRNARLIQSSMEEDSWSRLTPREQRAKQDFLNSEERVTRGFLSISQSALSLLRILSESADVSRVLARPPLCVRVSAAFIGFFDSLCGPRANELNVRKKDNFRFEPKLLLRGLSQVTSQILSADEGSFYTSLSTNQDLELRSFRRMCQLMREEGVGWSDSLSRLVERLTGDLGEESSLQTEDLGWLSEGLQMELELESMTEAYVLSLGEAQFDSCPLSTCHALRSALPDAAPSQSRLKALLKEAAQLQNSLPLHPDSSIFARQDEDRMDLVRGLITGPTGSPYAYGCFQFDCLFPQNYPAIPPLVKFCTTGGGTVRFNPNLYADGKVCLSLLGTWHGGDQSEKWDPQVSSLYQVLVSIQGIILIPEPLYNEPGYESIRGTQEGNKRSRETNCELALFTVRHAMCDVIRNPPEGFQELIQIHFSLLKPQILSQCLKWIQECPTDQMRARLIRSVREVRELLDNL